MLKTHSARQIGLVGAALLGTSAALVSAATPASAQQQAPERDVTVGYKGTAGDELCVKNVDGGEEQCAKLETDPVGKKTATIPRRTSQTQQTVTIKGTQLTTNADTSKANVRCDDENTPNTLTCQSADN